jgi:hypothetical protein
MMAENSRKYLILLAPKLRIGVMTGETAQKT